MSYHFETHEELSFFITKISPKGEILGFSDGVNSYNGLYCNSCNSPLIIGELSNLQNVVKVTEVRCGNKDCKQFGQRVEKLNTELYISLENFIRWGHDGP
jgi:hypothetical protein